MQNSLVFQSYIPLNSTVKNIRNKNNNNKKILVVYVESIKRNIYFEILLLNIIFMFQYVY